MEFAPQPQQSTPTSPDRKIELPLDREWSYQMILLMTRFPEIKEMFGKRKTPDGSEVVEDDLNDEMIKYWTNYYGIAFRTFWQGHPIIAQHIIDDRVEEDEVAEMVEYIRSHPATEEEIQKINDVSKYLH